MAGADGFVLEGTASLLDSRDWVGKQEACRAGVVEVQRCRCNEASM